MLAWAHHPLRTERNKTPMQLWIMGLQCLLGTGSTVAGEVFEVFMFYTNAISILAEASYLSVLCACWYTCFLAGSINGDSTHFFVLVGPISVPF